MKLTLRVFSGEALKSPGSVKVWLNLCNQSPCESAYEQLLYYRMFIGRESWLLLTQVLLHLKVDGVNEDGGSVNSDGSIRHQIFNFGLRLLFHPMIDQKTRSVGI